MPTKSLSIGLLMKLRVAHHRTMIRLVLQGYYNFAGVGGVPVQHSCKEHKPLRLQAASWNFQQKLWIWTCRCILVRNSRRLLIVCSARSRCAIRVVPLCSHSHADVFLGLVMRCVCWPRRAQPRLWSAVEEKSFLSRSHLSPPMAARVDATPLRRDAQDPLKGP